MPQKYTLDYIKQNKIAINCKSLEEAKQVYDICRHNWGYGAPEKAFEEYQDQLCLNCYLWYNGSYSDIEYYEKEGYTIIPASEFLQDLEESVLVWPIGWRDGDYYMHRDFNTHHLISIINGVVRIDGKQDDYTIEEVNRYVKDHYWIISDKPTDSTTPIAAIRTHLTAIDKLLKMIK